MSDPATCGCCAGTDAETPARIDNPPGQSAIVYRAGTWAAVRESLLARLSGSERPALRGLTTRDEGDFSIALCDSLAVVLDVLCFYQERTANEGYLRTATERRSLVELARLIGYEPAPGVAASTELAFTLQEVPGSPALAAGPVRIPVGTRVQSVPGPDEKPQSFETVEEIEARAEWNSIPVQTAVPWRPAVNDREVHLAGVATGIGPGDVIAIVGEDRLRDPGSDRWDLRVVTEVEADPRGRMTRVRWASGLGKVGGPSQPAGAGATVHVFRQRASLFGHNAPDPRLLRKAPLVAAGLVVGEGAELKWDRFEIVFPNVDLDAAYPKVTKGSWFALVSNAATAHPSGLSGHVELYQADAVSFPSRGDFGLSGKVTRLLPDSGSDSLKPFLELVRETLVLAQSEPLPVAETPLAYPLYGSTMALGRIAEGIGSGRTLAVTGKRARVRLRRGKDDVRMQTAAGEVVPLKAGDSLRLVGAPEAQTGAAFVTLAPEEFGAAVASARGTVLRLQILDRDGRPGACTLSASAIEIVPARDDDEEVSEIASVGAQSGAATHDRDRTTLALSAPLRNCYDRETTRVNANVAHATHGETVKEIVGSGDARRPNAEFLLRQSPLTYVSAPTASGRRSTLRLRLNDLEWQAVPRLYERGPAERVYVTPVDDEGRTTVRFGDGVEGARPPSGDHNIRATYRKGLGLAGNLASGRLTSLLSRPLGVTAVNNPGPARGGDDPETADRARTNAPLTVLTLDRAVSIRDYRDFARAFAGIAKAHAVWIQSGPARGVFVTVAGEQGAEVPETSDTYRNLAEALRRYGDPLVPLRLVTHRTARFRVRAAVKILAEADGDVVLPRISQRLRETFGFERRDFGQGVSADELTAIVQATDGVEAANVSVLNRDDPPTTERRPRLFAALPVASPDGVPLAAELLLLDEASLAVDVLP